MTTRRNTRRLAVVSLLAGVAFVLMYMHFPLPFLSPFAEFDLSAVPELIGGFLLGPGAAIQIVLVKICLKLLFQGTSSLLTGEVQNIILSLAFVLPAALYYRRHKTRRGAVVSLVLGGLINVAAAVFSNLYLILPAYITLYGMNWDSIVAMCGAINPWITNIPTMVAFSVVPFNLLARSINALLTLLVYKKISVPVKKILNDTESVRREKHELQCE